MMYKFTKTQYPQIKMLVCPQCCELLNRTDIEHFSTCPYCSCKLELTDELEDFLLEPIVDVWMAREQHQQIFSDSQSHSSNF